MLARQADAPSGRVASFIKRHMLRLFTLGELRLETNDGRVISRRRKPLVLLTYLARRAPKPASRNELATLLWGQRAEVKARQSLRQALLDVKQLVGGCIEIGQEAVHLNQNCIDLDVVAFELDIEAGHDREAIARWTGPFLGGSEDAGEMALELWLETERAGLHRRLTFAFERLLADAGRRGAWREAVTLARRWTEASPLDERAYTHLIAALRRDGHVVDALACHATFVSRVKTELDTQPSRSFLALAQSLSESVHATQDAVSVGPELHATMNFVGREPAFSALTSAWQARHDGHSVVVLIEADRGMGATRLCDEFASWVRTADSTTLVLRSSPMIGTEPPAPYSYAASILAPVRTAPALGGLAATTLAALAELLPRLRERFTHIQVPADSRTSEELTEAVADALDGISEDSPVVVIADRVTTADAESCALLLRLASSEQPALLYVIVTTPGDVAGDETIASLQSSAATRVITLGPITAPDIDAMLVSASHLSDDDRSRLATAILHDTGGTPAYAAWVIDALLGERLLATGTMGIDYTTALVDDREFPIPGRLRAMLEARMRNLDPDVRRTLEAAAVYGAPLTDRDADAVTHITAPASASALDALVRAGLLRRSTSGGSYELAPPVVARAIYALIPPLQREAMHTAAAAAIQKQSLRWRSLSTDRSRLRYHAQRSGAAPDRGSLITRWRVGIAAVAVGAVIIASYPLWRQPAPVRDRVVAIFPFEVNANAQLAFLRNGMVDLLGTSLDGAAGLRTVDPRAVIAATSAAQVGTPLTPDDARRIADRFSARYFILGDVIANGGNLQISATLYDTRSGTRAVARASATGDEPRLFALVDRLTAQLAVAQGANADERLTQLAAVTTTSVDALKAYLEGRAAYRSNDLPAALPAFERAVTADSTFALAWYGLATTASWMLRPGLERLAAAKAVAHEDRLSMRDRTLVEAFAAYSRGAADTAEQLTSSIVDSYKDDVEAWALLGEILYHHNWKRGRSLSESRRAWERVLSLDPNYWPALQHLSEVAALEGNRPELDSLLNRYQRSVGIPHVPITSLALRAYRFGDAASRDAIAVRVATDRGFWLTASIWYVAVDAQDVDGARRLALFLVDPVRPPEQQGFGRILLAHLALAQGKWREARAQLEIARVHSPNDALEYQLLLSMAPFLATSTTELQRQRSALVQLPISASDVANTMPWPYRFNSMHELIRPYVAGLASARDGDDVDRREALSELGSMDDSMKLSRGFTASIRAEHLRVTRHPSAALLELEHGALATPFVQAWTSGFVSQAYERYVRAELLHQLGRDDEALRWYGTFGENSPYDLVYLAPALYRQAQIYDARGQRPEAARRYTRFLRLWKDADPEFQQITNDARRRLARLQ